MELLIVILILGILAGLLFPAITMARRASEKGKTRSIITQVEAAADQFRTLNGAYPDTTTGPLGVETWVTKLATVNRDAFGPGAPQIVSVPHPTDTSLPDIPVRVDDAWSQALIYRPFEEYPLSDGSNTPRTANDDPPPNPDSFQVWSTGPNLRNELGVGDDLSNWSD